jgi:hypothetical protein
MKDHRCRNLVLLMMLFIAASGRDELPLSRALLQRVFPQQYSDEQELVPTDEHPKGSGAGHRKAPGQAGGFLSDLACCPSRPSTA